MGLFDVGAQQAVRITATIDAANRQWFQVFRRPYNSAPSGAWSQLGGDHPPGVQLYFGPVGEQLEYQVVGYHSGGRRSKELAEIDSVVARFRYEDWTDNDYNDLIVTCQRIDVPAEFSALVPKGYDPVQHDGKPRLPIEAGRKMS